MHHMKDIISQHKAEKPVGIYSVCSAHPLVIESTLSFELFTKNKVLIEATSNQCNQFGGYTGMKPKEFKEFVLSIADLVGFPHDRIILGGDHLGPNCWQNESAEEAMVKSEVLIAEYVKAGFTKIHLDASMSCADDPVPLDPQVVADRAARLCLVAENNAPEEIKNQLCYVIGTEVPVPGGEAEAISAIHVTTCQAAKQTIDTHAEAFKHYGIEGALDRVVGVVVQPGVEFDHSSVIHYDREQATELSHFIENTNYVFEAHSTDYQTKESFKALVEDHFAILKVGPAVTFALREALFALADIETQVVKPEHQSHLKEVIDNVMLDDQQFWKKYYNPQHTKAMVDLHYSLSDRIRYYWPNNRITSAIDTLFTNLELTEIPLGLLSQYMPTQLKQVVSSQIPCLPKQLVISKIQEVLADYSYGCGKHQ
ncbi:tagatose-bisphosphate aldolase subunit GatZ [Photobacterium sagamiensis]|uniref:tagatose-bisphosphate aldolase subunit GatZ n=1 Tax=Photobacterium sagamiensis TaxID=2910241 RepID=UPI003D0F94B5